MAYIGTDIFRLYDNAKLQYPDFDDWSSEVIRDTFGEDKRDALMAAKICKKTELPWNKADVFENIAIVLNGRDVIPDVSQDITIKEIAFAVESLNTEFPNDEFGDEIITYIAAEADEDGMVVLPPSLSFASIAIPKIFLNDEQQKVQNEYLEECKVYSDMLKNITSSVQVDNIKVVNN